MTGKPRKGRRRRSDGGEKQLDLDTPATEIAATEETLEPESAVEPESGPRPESEAPEAEENGEAAPETIDLSAVDPDSILDAGEPLGEAIAGEVATPEDLEASLGPETLDLSADAFAGESESDEDPTIANLEDLLEEPAEEEPVGEIERDPLKGALEALVFASDRPLTANELAKLVSAPPKDVKTALTALRREYLPRGLKLDEVAGGYVFRTDPIYASYVRDLTKAKPVKLSRAQIETLAILAYRQPITRPEIDEIRGVDCGAVLKMLLERDLIRILGKKDEPGRPLLYGTTQPFLEFFGLKSLKDLPTLREFTELNEESRRVVERELGEVYEPSPPTVRAGSPSEGEEEQAPAAPSEETEQEPAAPSEETEQEPAAPSEETEQEPAAPSEETEQKSQQDDDEPQTMHEAVPGDAEDGDHSSSAGSE